MAGLAEILTEVAARVMGLGITQGGVALPVLIRKLPGLDEQLDAVPCFIVCPAGDRPTSSEPWIFGGWWRTVHQVDVVLVGPGDRDWGKNLSGWAGWRDQVRQAFLRPGLPAVEGVADTRTSQEAAFARRMLARNYDYSVLTLAFTQMEQIAL